MRQAGYPNVGPLVIDRPVLRGYIDGLTLSNGTDADHDIDIATGIASDSTGAYWLALTSGLTKQIDATWAAGDNAGGLFSGSVAADTTYHVFLIRKDSDGSIDAGFDTSVTASNIPSGYTAYRRIGSLYTDSSSNWVVFTQSGDRFILAALSTTDYADPGTSAFLHATAVPSGIFVEVEVDAVLRDVSPAASTYVILSSPFATDTEPAPANCTLAQASTASNRMANTVYVTSNTSRQIRARLSNSDGGIGLSLTTKSWRDWRSV